LTIPEIDLVLQAGTLGGRFTTVEGILQQVYEELSDKIYAGDASTVSLGDRTKFAEFLHQLKRVSKFLFHEHTHDWWYR
jgi:zinc finger protein